MFFPIFIVKKLNNFRIKIEQCLFVCLTLHLSVCPLPFCHVLWHPHISAKNKDIATKTRRIWSLGSTKYIHDIKGWPCPPGLRSGTLLNVLQVPPWRTPHSWHTSKKDINTKLSGYHPLGQTRSSMTSRMTLSSKFLVRNPRHPPSTPMKDPPIFDTLPINWMYHNFSGEGGFCPLFWHYSTYYRQLR